jgi:glycosyltransferase involved in cell wall biosynthesis
LKLYFRTDDCNVGDAYGYFKVTTLMRDALIAEGVQITTNPAEPFDIALHISGADYWRPIDGRKNVLFTMMETTGLPEHWRDYFHRADLLIVPCQHNKPIYQTRYDGRIEVCPFGASAQEFPYFERKNPAPSEPFRFLWVGGPSARKGQYQAVIAFTRWLRQGAIPSNAQLYLKSTDHGKGGMVTFRVGVDKSVDNHPWGVDFLPETILPSSTDALPSVVHDWRNLTTEQLNDLYRSAHAFLLPSLGEGWGLTLTEAMSTGLPCIWSHWSGPVDYADETIGYPLTRFRVGRFFVSDAVFGSDGKAQSWTDWERSGAIVDPQEIIEHMGAIYADYSSALERGRLASERIQTQYTWRHAARKLIKILEGIC